MAREIPNEIVQLDICQNDIIMNVPVRRFPMVHSGAVWPLFSIHILLTMRHVLDWKLSQKKLFERNEDIILGFVKLEKLMRKTPEEETRKETNFFSLINQ